MVDDLRDSFCSALKLGYRHPFSVAIKNEDGQDLEVHYFEPSNPPYALSFDKNGLEYRVNLKKSKNGKAPFRVIDYKGSAHDMIKQEAIRALKITEDYLSENPSRFDFGQQLMHLHAKMLILSEKRSVQIQKCNDEKRLNI